VAERPAFITKLGGILVETATPEAKGHTGDHRHRVEHRADALVRDAVAAPVTDLQSAGWRAYNALLAQSSSSCRRRSILRARRVSTVPRGVARRHALQRRNVTLWRAGYEVAAGIAIGVDSDGALLLQTPTGVRQVLSGEPDAAAGSMIRAGRTG
jgi:biotin-(acetyl-CoA carboxylase) ligase